MASQGKGYAWLLDYMICLATGLLGRIFRVVADTMDMSVTISHREHNTNTTVCQITHKRNRRRRVLAETYMYVLAETYMYVLAETYRYVQV